METSLSRTYYKTLGRVLQRLAARKGEWKEIGEAVGVPHSTIKHIAHGRIKQPSVDVIENLDQFLSKRNGKRSH